MQNRLGIPETRLSRIILDNHGHLCDKCKNMINAKVIEEILRRRKEKDLYNREYYNKNKEKFINYQYRYVVHYNGVGACGVKNKNVLTTNIDNVTCKNCLYWMSKRSKLTKKL